MNNLVNRVVLVGNLGGNPELKKVGENNHVLNLSLATNEYYTNSSGDKETKTTWHRVVAWGKQAEFLSDKCQTGSKLMVEGRLETKKWEKDGDTRYFTDVRMTEFLLLDPKNKS